LADERSSIEPNHETGHRERPDQFSKVLSIVGSFTNIRGGHIYPEKVRASEKKPIRVFFQDG
jgi:enterochelin esterase family protein